MKRRELVKLISLATSASVTIPLSGSLLSACKNMDVVAESEYSLQFFNQKEYSFIIELLETLLPKTDSPSAVEVGVHQIIDSMVGTVYSPEKKVIFSNNMDSLIKYIGSGNLAGKVETLLNSENEAERDAKDALISIKQQAVAYYLSTEEVAKKHLNYLPNPGEYQPCITLDSVKGKLWA